MNDVIYRTEIYATRRFPGWCVLIYAKPSRVIRGVAMGPWIERVVFDRDRIEAEMRAMAFVAGGMG